MNRSATDSSCGQPDRCLSPTHGRITPVEALQVRHRSDPLRRSIEVPVMARLMSVTLTEAAVVARTKTVTRRLGWNHIKPGDRLTLCRKVMGRKRKDGTVEPLVRLAEVEVVDVRREPLHAITRDDVAREGFRDIRPQEFVEFFCQHMKCGPDTEVNRIEWRYLEESC